MVKKSKKQSRKNTEDVNQIAFRVVQESTSEEQLRGPTHKKSPRPADNKTP